MLEVVDGYRFEYNEDFSGEISIHAPHGQTEQRTMDGRIGLAVPADTILKFVGQAFVKRVLVDRIATMDPIAILVGSM